MPDEYLACVDSYLKKNVPKNTAQRVCAIAYYKRHGRSVSSAESLEDAGKWSVCGSTDLPLADRGRKWDASAAEARIFAWAGFDTDSPDVSKAEKCFFAHDASAPEKKGSYKLPFADIIDGSPKAVPAGVIAVAGVLGGARTETTLPAAVLSGVRSKVAAYYGKMDMPVPWKKSDAAESVAMIELPLWEQMELMLPNGIVPADMFDGDFLELTPEYKRMSLEDRKAAVAGGNLPHRKYPIKNRGRLLTDLWVVAWVLEEKLRSKLEGSRPSNVILGGSRVDVRQPAGVQTLTAESDDHEILILEDVGPSGAQQADDSDVIMRFVGTALVDGAVSKSGRTDPPAYYDATANDIIMYETNAAIAADGPLTLFASHVHAAIGALPFGIVVNPLFREGSRIKYEGHVLGTSVGRDVAILLRNRARRKSSIRSVDWAFESFMLGDQPVARVVRGTIAGIDLAEYPGVEGAEITEIHEDQQEVEDMGIDMKELTLDMLREGRPDLLKAIEDSVVIDGQTLGERLAAIQGQRFDQLKDVVTALTEDRDALRAEVASLKATVEAAEAAKQTAVLIDALLEGIEHPDLVRAELARMTLTPALLEGDAGKALVESAEKHIKTILAGTRGAGDSFVGIVHVEESEITEAQEQVLGYMFDA